MKYRRYAHGFTAGFALKILRIFIYISLIPNGQQSLFAEMAVKIIVSPS